jgi:hypothetical protein
MRPALWATIIAGVAGALPALAQNFPVKPVRLIVGFAPGGGTDLAARYVAAALTELWDATVLVDNRAGAGGAVATELAVRAAPDGYTVTLCTIGHAITLFLSVLELISLDIDWVEFLIPCTILVTAMMNLLFQKQQVASHAIQYGMALGFGLIHGLGYANYIRMILSADQQLIWGLFSFNLGLEAGQIVVVCLVLLTVWISSRVHAKAHMHWVRFASVFVLFFALKLALERFPF